MTMTRPTLREGFKEGKGIMAGPVRRCMRAPLNAANRAPPERLRRKAPLLEIKAKCLISTT